MRFRRTPSLAEDFEADPANVRPEVFRALERSLAQARAGKLRPAKDLMNEILVAEHVRAV